MDPQIEKYTRKLIRDRTADPASIRFYRLDDVMIAGREDEWAPVFAEVFNGLNATALLLARPALRFADLLIAAAEPGTKRLSPQDNETRTFFHDIPFVRRNEWTADRKHDLAGRIVRCLKERKAAIVEGLGLIGLGGVTIEQAYIAYSTLFHTTFLKFCLDILERGFRNQEEREAFDELKNVWVRPADMEGLHFSDLRGRPSPRPSPRKGEGASDISSPLRGEDTGERGRKGQVSKDAIYEELCRVGRYTVEKGLVDSFFGNISWFDGTTIFISQTASSLDELEGHIDPVPLDNTSTAGLSASSELPAHRAIYQSSGYHAVLHGHPKFSIILSMHCEEKDCEEKDCGRNCRRKRTACGVPIVSGEIGAGGLAKTVPGAVRENGICIVHGHGVFSAGETGFRDAFRKMVECENRCREEYFRMVESEGKRGRR
ncbi:MAG TPA: class II aldolase/adducin family protein [Nitrospirota bacterium]|nr:class II aldolase/adducin family protein [Nitrospirota bacterium]